MIRNLRVIRESKGMSRATLSKETGVSPDSIWKYETGRSQMLNKCLDKIAVFLNVPIEELGKEVEAKVEECKSKPCLNEKCLLNKNKQCINDLVLSGKLPCFGKDKVQAKDPKIDFNSTAALFFN